MRRGHKHDSRNIMQAAAHGRLAVAVLRGRQCDVVQCLLSIGCHSIGNASSRRLVCSKTWVECSLGVVHQPRRGCSGSCTLQTVTACRTDSSGSRMTVGRVACAAASAGLWQQLHPFGARHCHWQFWQQRGCVTSRGFAAGRAAGCIAGRRGRVMCVQEAVGEDAVSAAPS